MGSHRKHKMDSYIHTCDVHYKYCIWDGICIRDGTGGGYITVKVCPFPFFFFFSDPLAAFETFFEKHLIIKIIIVIIKQYNNNNQAIKL